MWIKSKKLLLALFPSLVLGDADWVLKNRDHLERNKDLPGVISLPSGLQYKVLKEGQGQDSPKRNSVCTVHYRGELIDGTEFDSSYKRGKPAKFKPSQVVSGWTEALQLMRAGDKWELTIPPELGYGMRDGSGPGGKGGSVLVFELELLSFPAGGRSWEDRLGTPVGTVLDAVDPSNPIHLLMMAYMAYKFFNLLQALVGGGGGGGAATKQVKLPDASGAPGNPRVFFDVAIGSVAEDASLPPRRVEFELFAGVAPRTCENFRALCTGEKGVGAGGKPLHFKGSAFHRVIPNFMLQGGDFTRGNGTGGESIYGSKFADEWEHGWVGHSVPGLLSMANAGPNTNGSQFFVTTAVTPWLDKKHVVFGRVVSGMEVVRAVEAQGSSSGATKVKVTITDCGEVKTKGT